MGRPLLLSAFVAIVAISVIAVHAIPVELERRSSSGTAQPPTYVNAGLAGQVPVSPSGLSNLTDSPRPAETAPATETTNATVGPASNDNVKPPAQSHEQRPNTNGTVSKLDGSVARSVGANATGTDLSGQTGHSASAQDFNSTSRLAEGSTSIPADDPGNKLTQLPVGDGHPAPSAPATYTGANDTANALAGSAAIANATTPDAVPTGVNGSTTASDAIPTGVNGSAIASPTATSANATIPEAVQTKQVATASKGSGNSLTTSSKANLAESVLPGNSTQSDFSSNTPAAKSIAILPPPTNGTEYPSLSQGPLASPQEDVASSKTKSMDMANHMASKTPKEPARPSPSMNAEFSGQTIDTAAKPFLAQTDTIFSTDSQRAYEPAPYEVRYRAVGDLNGRFDVLKHWGELAPYFSSPIYPDMQRFRSVPSHCKVKQAHILHRHGARMPGADGFESAPKFARWFANVTSENPQLNDGKKASFDGPLSFLSTWTYTLGSNVLAPAGYQQMFDSGIHAHYRYAGLFNASAQKHKPIIRTTSRKHMVDSAKTWALGYFGANADSLVDSEIQVENSGFNSTLAAHNSCIGAKTDLAGTDMKAQWIQSYLVRAVKRLQHHVHGANLTPEVVFGMQSICPYETYALGLSQFCDLFSKEEWEGFEYAHDLAFQGAFGFMSKTGGAQGIGWAQELVARLTGSKLSTPYTSQNSTLDDDPRWFPLDQKLYADFTHGEQMVSVLTALNFTTFSTELSTDHADPMRNFVLSHIVPSAARLNFEVLQCDERRNPNSGDVQRHYIRTFLNDALLPMTADQGCTGHKSKRDGLCPLESFVTHVEKVAVPAANYDEVCFGGTSPGGNSTSTATALNEAATPTAPPPSTSNSTVLPPTAKADDPSALPASQDAAKGAVAGSNDTAKNNGPPALPAVRDVSNGQVTGGNAAAKPSVPLHR